MPSRCQTVRGRKGDTMTHETTSAASERAAIIEAQLTACRVQRDEAIARRDELAGENERLRAIEAAVREWARRNRVCDVAEEDGSLDGDGVMPDGTDCPTWCGEAWGAIEAALAAAPAGESEVARLREELRIVSRYAARLYDAAEAVAEALDAACYSDSLADAGAARDQLYEASGASDGCEVWHAALQRGREDGR